MRSSLLLVPLALLAGASAGPPLAAQDLVHEVIYTDLPGWPQNDVPGMPGVHFYRSSSYSWEGNAIAVSPEGHHALIAATDDFAGARLVLMVDGQVLLEEGGPGPGAPSELMDSLGNGSVDINRYGVLGLLGFTDGPSSTSEYVLSYDGAWQIAAQAGGSVAAVPGATYNGFSGRSALAIDDNGALAYEASISGGSFGIGLFHGGIVLARGGIDAPTGQLTGNNDAYTAFRNGHEVRLSPDGSRWATTAYLTYPMVLAVDNAVVVQESYAIPGSGSSTLAWDRYSVSFDTANRWYGLGRFLPTNSNDRWAARDGVILARTGAETWPGSGFNWGDRIEWVTGDGYGDSYVGGDYDIPPYSLVNTGPPPRPPRGDPIDMDGNGLYDDNVTMYIAEPFGQATDDGSLYTVVLAHDANANQYGNVFLRIGPPLPKLELLNLVAGQTAELKTSQAAPGDPVYMAYSLRGPGPATVSSPWGPLTVALSPPFVRLPVVTADPNGEAVYPTTVPAGAAGASVWAHAAVISRNRARLSNAVAAVVQ